jgi:polysaccharide biosynthesis transport protein
LNTRLRLNIDDQLKLRERQDRAAGVVLADAADPLETLRARLADLQSRFTDRHPDVIRIKSQIAELERAMTSGSRQSATRRPPEPTGELASLEREERTLRSEIAAYEHRIRSAPAIQQELEALERDYGAAKESYSTIFKRYEEAQLADSLEDTKTGESVRILDAAVVPAFPAAPNRMRLLIMALFFALAAGVGMMLVTEHVDTSFHSVGELRQFTTLPVLATIPYVPSRMTLASVLRTTLAAVAVIGLCVLLAGFAYRTARENTQLVWMLSAPQL